MPRTRTHLARCRDRLALKHEIEDRERLGQVLGWVEGIHARFEDFDRLLEGPEARPKLRADLEDLDRHLHGIGRVLHEEDSFHLLTELGDAGRLVELGWELGALHTWTRTILAAFDDEAERSKLSPWMRTVLDAFAKPGRPELFSWLDLVVDFLADYWEDELERRFTRRFEPGDEGAALEPKSPAAKFVYDVLSWLDPTVTASNCNTVMRRVKEQRKVRNGRKTLPKRVN